MVKVSQRNAEKAEAASEAMKRYVTRADMENNNLADLLADLMHMARKRNIKWDFELDLAVRHFQHEVAEESLEGKGQ